MIEINSTIGAHVAMVNVYLIYRIERILQGICSILEASIFTLCPLMVGLPMLHHKHETGVSSGDVNSGIPQNEVRVKANIHGNESERHDQGVAWLYSLNIGLGPAIKAK